MASIVKLSSFSLETVGRTVLSGAGAPNARHRGSLSLRGPGEARPETKPRARGGFGVTTIDFRTDPATARRHRVVSLERGCLVRRSFSHGGGPTVRIPVPFRAV